MASSEPHPQRCLHSKRCVWNRGRPSDCIDTDCSEHRYVYASHSSASAPLPLIEYCDNEVCMDNGRPGCVPENCNYIKSVKVQNRIKHDASIAAIRQQERNPCGDTCKGECSGEVDGVPHCPSHSSSEKTTTKVLQTELLKIVVTKEKKYKTSMDIRSEPLSYFEGEPDIHATITAEGCIIAHKFNKIMVRADEITFEESIAEDGTKYLYICKKE